MLSEQRLLRIHTLRLLWVLIYRLFFVGSQNSQCIICKLVSTHTLRATIRWNSLVDGKCMLKEVFHHPSIDFVDI